MYEECKRKWLHVLQDEQFPEVPTSLVKRMKT